jgi:LTXXQ motif family protein
MFAKILLTGIAVAALALAQGGMGSGAGADTGTGGMGGGGGGRGGGKGGDTGGGGAAPRPQKESKADMMVNRLKLNKDQKSEFETILESTIKDSQPIVQTLFQSRQNLANGLLSAKSETEIAALNKALADAQFQMIGVEVMAFKKIVGLLKPNQTAKAPEAFDLMADIFLPQLGGGGGGGRGRGGSRQ